jgi:hypothetical protein
VLRVGFYVASKFIGIKNTPLTICLLVKWFGFQIQTMLGT